MTIDKLKDELITVLYVYKGISNAKTGKYMATKYGVNIRTVQVAIEQLREEGHPVCSNDCGFRGSMGYYIPATRQEADTFFRSAKARARKTFISVANVAKALNASFGVDEYQMELSL
jgi:hypothetical protein